MTLPGGSTPASDPVWSPTLEQVAAYVPWLTVSAVDPATQTFLNTFNADTEPADTEAYLHIADAATIVGGLVGTLPSTLYSLAATATALWAAATLAAAYARDEDDARRAADLLARATLARDGLVSAADNAGAASLSPLPVLYAPEPVGWGDLLLDAE